MGGKSFSFITCESRFQTVHPDGRREREGGKGKGGGGEGKREGREGGVGIRGGGDRGVVHLPFPFPNNPKPILNPTFSPPPTEKQTIPRKKPFFTSSSISRLIFAS